VAKRKVQAAYGALGPWSLVERVSAAEFGQASNVVRYRTRAESGKKIVEMLARNAGRAELAAGDREDLVKECERWLAVS
jgi:hypothetical protein